MGSIEECLIEHSNIESQLEMKSSNEVHYTNLNDVNISDIESF